MSLPIDIFICTGLSHRSHADEIAQYVQSWCNEIHDVNVMKLSSYVGHTIETLLYIEALKQAESYNPDNFSLILTDRFKLTSYGKAKLENKLAKMILDEDVDIHYLSNSEMEKTHEAMLISPEGRRKILGDLGLSDGRIFQTEKNLARQLHREIQAENFCAHFSLNDFFVLDPANIKINHQYENDARNDPVVLLPQLVPPPQFRISGLVWFIFIVFIVLIVAWAVIKIGPGGHKTTKSDEELAQQHRIPLRGETQFFEPLPYVDQLSPYIIG